MPDRLLDERRSLVRLLLLLLLRALLLLLLLLPKCLPNSVQDLLVIFIHLNLKDTRIFRPN